MQEDGRAGELSNRETAGWVVAGWSVVEVVVCLEAGRSSSRVV